ncbi:Membrane lipoprotein TmpC [subsurface metagenome]
MNFLKKTIFTILTLSIIASLSLTLIGCPPAEEAVEEPTPTEEVEFEAAMATDVGKLGDKSFNDGVYAGLEKAEAELGVEIDVVISEQQTDYVPNLTKLAEDGNNVVFAVGFMMGDSIKEVAEKFPDTYFGGIDISLADADFNPIDVPNIREILFREQEVGYLAGVFAGMMTKEDSIDGINADNVIGMVGGMKIPPVDRFIAGYIAGAKSVNPDIQIEIIYTETFTDPAIGKEAAIAQYEAGADIVFQVAGLTGVGVFEAAADKGNYAIGVDVDQSISSPDNAPVILTSAEKFLTQATFLTIKDALEGNFTGGDTAYGLENDGVGLSPFHEHEDIVPQEIKDAIEKAKQDIIAGTVVPPETPEEIE